jgi:hypothetical protein
LTCLQLTISPTFYALLFCTKVLARSFLHIYFRFLHFWRKNIDAKAAPKMLVKLTPGQLTHAVRDLGLELATLLPELTQT